ncbi:UV DNA damage endonuclease [compost metagenome]
MAASASPWLTNRRIGFAVKVLGSPHPLKSNDARRPENAPHLRVSLGYLREIFAYLRSIDVSMYRMSSDLAPYLTHPDRPEFHRQLEDCEEEIRALGESVRAQGLRLSFHPSQYILLSAQEERVLEASRRDFAWQATFLDWMGLSPEAVVVTHVGGVYGDKRAAMERWIRNYEALPKNVRRRLVLENDDTLYSVADVAWIHDRCGVPLVYDYQHHMCFNPDALPLREAMALANRTWSMGIRPKIHFSSPLTASKLVERRNPKTGKVTASPHAPDMTQHAEYLNPFEFIWFMEEVGDMAFDVMVEAKGKDLAVLRLREELAKRHPMIRKHAGRRSNVTIYY